MLLITHALQYLSMMDYVIKMNEGNIEFFGNIKDAEKQEFYKDFINDNQSKNLIKSIDQHQLKVKKKNKNKFKFNESEGDFSESEKFLQIVKSNKRRMMKSKNKKRNKYIYHKMSKYEILKIVFTYAGGCHIFFAIIFFK